MVRLIFALLVVALPAKAAEQLAVFYPTTLAVPDMEKALKADAAMAAKKVVVYAKFSEFESAQQADPAKFIIVPSAFVKYNKDYSPALQFTKGGKDEFQYLLLSIHDKWNKDSIGTGVVGLVEQLGRKERKEYTEFLMGGNGFKRIKVVTKIEDLFPLLALDNADYIFIEPDQHEKLKEKFKAQTNLVAKTVAVGFPVVCVKGDASAADLAAFKKISSQTLQALGFDGLSEPRKGK